MGECEYGQSETDPEESIREYRPFQSDQNGIHLERCQCVRHEDKDVEADCGIQQLAEGRHLKNVGNHASRGGNSDEEQHSAEVADDGSAFQRGQRELDRRESEGGRQRKNTVGA